MISIVNQIGSLSDQAISRLSREKNNQINIIFRSEQSQPIEVKINRGLFLKGCGSQQLGEACKNRDEQIVLPSPQYFLELISIQQNQLALKQFLRYLASGKLQFQTNMFGINFLLACVFNVRLFFTSIINQNIRIPIQNSEFKNILCNCCFDFFNNILNEDGKYNFIWWIFKKYQINWFKTMQNNYSENTNILNSFIIQYTSYKVENNKLTSDDVLQLINIIKITGKSVEDAKNKVKKMVKWQMISIQVLQDSAKILKFTDQQVKAIIQKRLSKMESSKGKQIDEQFKELQNKKQAAKIQFQKIITTNATNKLRKILFQSGVTPVDFKPKQSLKKYNQVLSNSYQQLDQPCYEQPHFNNPYIQDSSILVNKSQQCLLQQQIQILLNSSNMINQPQPNFNKKQDHQINNHQNKPTGFKNSLIHELDGCDFNKSFHLQCGCEVCQSCMKNRYVMRTSKFQALSDDKFQFQPNDFQRYNICCYQCNKQLDEIDAITYNSI